MAYGLETAFLDIAEHIAREAHVGQFYGDKDYFEGHILPVVNMVCRLGYGPRYQATAFLHDVQEDHDLSVDYLRQEGIPEDVAEAVDLLSKTSDMSHVTYLSRITTSGLAVVGKYCDSSVNFANTILSVNGITDDKFQEWAHEYAGNIAFLRPLLPSPEIG